MYDSRGSILMADASYCGDLLRRAAGCDLLINHLVHAGACAQQHVTTGLLL